MNEYITLPSNTADFEDNKTSNFRVKLPNPIHLEGEWEMGLVEIQYPYSWNNIHGRTYLGNLENCILFLIRPDTIPIFIEIESGYYDTIHELIAGIQIGIEKTKKEKLSLENPETPENKKMISQALDSESGFAIKYNQISKRVTVKLNTEVIDHCIFGRHIQYMLGFDTDRLESFSHPRNIAKYPPDLTAGFTTLYLYCNLIQPQIVGGSLVPLLRTIPIRQHKFGESVDREFLSPHYIRLRTNSFDTVEISIKNDSNELVGFNFGKVIAKIHLRKRK